jgi:hypothetical protein
MLNDIARCAGGGCILCQKCRRRTETVHNQPQIWQQFTPRGDCTAPHCDGYMPPNHLASSAGSGV